MIRVFELIAISFIREVFVELILNSSILFFPIAHLILEFLVLLT